MHSDKSFYPRILQEYILNWKWAMWNFFKKTVYGWVGENSFEHAAALAFATLFSLAPILIIVIGLSAIFLGQDAVEGRIFYQIRYLIGQDGAATIQDILQKATYGNKKAATTIGFILSLLGASGAFSQMRDSLNRIWMVRATPGSNDILLFFKDRLISFAMLVVIGFLLLVSLALSAALSYFGDAAGYYLPLPPWLLNLVNSILSMALITCLFAMIFKVLPDIVIRWRDVWLGAAVTAGLFTGGKYLIATYLGKSGVTTVYGAAASLVVIMLWVYYSSLILYYGAHFIRVYTETRKSPVLLAPNAVWVRYQTYKTLPPE